MVAPLQLFGFGKKLGQLPAPPCRDFTSAFTCRLGGVQGTSNTSDHIAQVAIGMRVKKRRSRVQTIEANSSWCDNKHFRVEAISAPIEATNGGARSPNNLNAICLSG
jgi:hypothetical protein